MCSLKPTFLKMGDYPREPFAVKKKRMSEMTEIDWRFVVFDKTRKCQLTLKYVTRPLIHCTTVLLMYTNKKKLSANRIRSCFGFPAPQIMFTSWEFEWTRSYFEHEMNFSLSLLNSRKWHSCNGTYRNICPDWSDSRTRFQGGFPLPGNRSLSK